MCPLARNYNYFYDCNPVIFKLHRAYARGGGISGNTVERGNFLQVYMADYNGRRE